MEIEYDFIGFLCVDARKEYTFGKKQLLTSVSNMFVDLMEAYASMLYIYFNRCRYLIVSSVGEEKS